MKRVFLYLLLIVLLGCRNEDVWVENIKYEEESRKFSVFTAQSSNDTIDYAKGFEILAKRYDSIYYPKSTKKIVSLNRGYNFENKENSHIYFKIRSNVLFDDTGDVGIIFPKIKNDKVANLVLALLTNEETEVYYYDINIESEFHKIYIDAFSKAYEGIIKGSKKNRISSKSKGLDEPIGKETLIEEVVIYVFRERGMGRERWVGGGLIWNFPIMEYPIIRGNCEAFDDCRVGGGSVGGGSSSRASNPNMVDYLDDEERDNPCGNNKKIASNSIVNAKNNDLKEKLKDIKKNKVEEKDIFEDGYTFDRESNGDINPNVRVNRQEGQSGMIVSIKGNTVGYNHTHPRGVKMFSPRDINTFINLIRNAKKNNIPYNELFATVVFERDNRHYVYQMTYIGDGNDLPVEFTEEQLKKYTDIYGEEAKEYVEYGEGQMYIDDGYRLFLSTLKNMGVKNVQLSDVSNSQKPIIIEDNRGRPKKVNCK